MGEILLYKNNATSTLAGSITSSQTTANLAAGTGALFPAPGAGEGFYGSFVDAATGLLTEIVFVYAVSGDTITMTRGQDGTSGLAWNAGDIFSQFCTAADMALMLQTAAAIGRLSGPPQLVVSTAGSLTFPAATNAVLAYLLGGGGAGGGAVATGAGQCSAGAGGNSGCLVTAYVTAGFQGSSLSIGTAGAAVSGAAGGSGGSTIWTLGSGGGGLVYTANGGAGGAVSVAGAPPFAIGPAVTTPAAPVLGEYFATAGVQGGPGMAFSTGSIVGGVGGAAPAFGSGGGFQGGIFGGYGYGAGGAGDSNGPSAAAGAGGPGFQGMALYFPYT
jgi:hypothetical protein